MPKKSSRKINRMMNSGRDNKIKKNQISLVENLVF